MTEQTPPKGTRYTPRPKPAVDRTNQVGKLTDHLKDVTPRAKKNAPMVAPKDRKIGRPTTRVRSLVNELANGRTYKEAAVAAGLPVNESNPDGMRLNAADVMRRPYAREMLANIRAETATTHQITRANVLAGLKEAIDMARIQADPAVMIAGWKEIGKMCGFYEAVKVKVQVSGGATSIQAKLSVMSDDELLRLANGETVEALEGEFTRE